MHSGRDEGRCCGHRAGGMSDPVRDTVSRQAPGTLLPADVRAGMRAASMDDPAAPDATDSGGCTAALPGSMPTDPRPGFTSLLCEEGGNLRVGEDPADRAFVSDLNLDQIVDAVAGDREERDLIRRLLYQQVRDVGTLQYRHEVFRDLEDPGLFQAAGEFAEQMRQVRAHLGQLAKMQSGHQREGWFLDAAAIYCDAVRSLAADLAARPIASRGLLAFRDYLAAYIAVRRFAAARRPTPPPARAIWPRSCTRSGSRARGWR